MWNWAAVLNVLREDWSRKKKKQFFPLPFLETPKGACLCAVWPRSAVTGSCLLPGSSISVRLDLGTTLPGADRSNDTSKKHKMNRLFKQRPGQQYASKRACSARLEVLRNRGSPLKHSHTRYVQSSCLHLVKKIMMPNPMIRSRSLNQLSLL